MVKKRIINVLDVLQNNCCMSLWNIGHETRKLSVDLGNNKKTAKVALDLKINVEDSFVMYAYEVLKSWRR